MTGVMERAFDPAYGEAWSAPQLAAAFAHGATFGQVALAGDTPKGFALARLIVDEAELLLVAVDPAARRLGIGRELVEAVATQARDCGGVTLFLEVREGNLPAVQLYKSTGFTVAGRRPSYYGGRNQERFDGLTMRRSL